MEVQTMEVQKELGEKPVPLTPAPLAQPLLQGAEAVAHSMVRNQLLSSLTHQANSAHRKVCQGTFPGKSQTGGEPQPETVFGKKFACLPSKAIVEVLPDEQALKRVGGRFTGDTGELSQFVIHNAGGAATIYNTAFPLKESRSYYLQDMTNEDVDSIKKREKDYDLKKAAIMRRTLVNEPTPPRLGINEALLHQVLSVGNGLNNPVVDQPSPEAFIKEMKNAISDAAVMDVVAQRSKHLSVCKSLLGICRKSLEMRNSNVRVTAAPPLKNEDFYALLGRLGGNSDTEQLLVGIFNRTGDGTLLDSEKMITVILKHIEVVCQKPSFTAGIFVPNLADAGGDPDIGALLDIALSEDGLTECCLKKSELKPKMPDAPAALAMQIDAQTDFKQAHQELEVFFKQLPSFSPHDQLPPFNDRKDFLHRTGALETARRIVLEKLREAELQRAEVAIDAMGEALQITDTQCRLSITSKLGVCMRILGNCTGETTEALEPNIPAFFVQLFGEGGGGPRAVSTEDDTTAQRCDIIRFFGNNLSDAFLQGRKVDEADYRYTMAELSRFLVVDERYADTLQCGENMGSTATDKIPQGRVGSLDTLNETDYMDTLKTLGALCTSPKKAGKWNVSSKIFNKILKSPVTSLLGAGIVLSVAFAALIGFGIVFASPVIGATALTMAFIFTMVFAGFLVIELTPVIVLLIVGLTRKNSKPVSGTKGELKFLEEVMDGKPQALKRYAHDRHPSLITTDDQYKKTEIVSLQNREISLIQAQAAKEYMDRIDLAAQHQVFDAAMEKLERLGRSQKDYMYRTGRLKRKNVSGKAVTEAIWRGAGSEAAQTSGFPSTEGGGASMPMSGLKEAITLAALIMAKPPAEYATKDQAADELEAALTRLQRTLLKQETFPDADCNYPPTQSQRRSAWDAAAQISDALKGVEGLFYERINAEINPPAKLPDETGPLKPDIENPVFRKLQKK